jgi:hypothetical protein
MLGLKRNFNLVHGRVHSASSLRGGAEGDTLESARSAPAGIVDFNEAVAAGAVDVDEEQYDEVMGATNSQLNYGEIIGVSSSRLADFVSAERQSRASSVTSSSSLWIMTQENGTVLRRQQLYKTALLALGLCK